LAALFSTLSSALYLSEPINTSFKQARLTNAKHNLKPNPSVQGTHTSLQ